MKAAAIAMAVGTMLTVEQRDPHRSNFDHASAAVSADGRFVAFTTYSRLVAEDASPWSDVYVLDRARRHVTLESAAAGAHAGDSSHPSISGDGRYVAFERADSVVFRDREAGITKIVGMGHQPSITENGGRVLFAAGRFDSATGVDANGEKSDIYVVDMHGARARRVSVDLEGLDPSATASVHPAGSRDGRFVAFSSRIQAAGSGTRSPQVFVRDTTLNTTRHVGAGWDPSLSGDGRFVAFVGLSNRLPQIFLRDLHTGATRIITNSVRRGLANGASAKPKVSSDGRFVAFQSEASDLVAAEDFNLLWDVFIFERTTGTLARVSGDPEGVWMEPSGGPSIDATGSVVAFSSRHPTDASDKRNDFDLYVATLGTGVFTAETRRRKETLSSLLYPFHQHSQLHQVRPLRDRELQVLHRFRRSRWHVGQQHAEIHARLDALRLNLHRRLEVREGFRMPRRHVHQQGAHIVTGAKMIGVDAQHRLVMRDGHARAIW
jgi:Tol biopolymer transport system component